MCVWVTGSSGPNDMQCVCMHEVAVAGYLEEKEVLKWLLEVQQMWTPGHCGCFIETRPFFLAGG